MTDAPLDGQADDSSQNASSHDASESGAEAAVCDRHLPTCPSSPPSYQTDIAPIFLAVCVDCHYRGSDLARTPLQTYSEIYNDRGSVLDQVYSCRMPPSSYLPLPVEQRTAVLTWLECGAPNN